MKFPYVIKFANFRTPAVAAVAAFSFLGIASGAVLVDDFESGYTLGDVTTQTGGTGWSTPWAKNGPATFTGNVIGSGSNITGNSLQISTTNVNQLGAFSRTYDPQTIPYTLRFDIRVNNVDAILGGGGGTAEDYFQIFDRPGTQGEFGADGTWLIRGAQLTGGPAGATYDATSALTWNLFNYTPLTASAFNDANMSVIDTGIELQVGNIYEFAVNILGGGTWSASISDGTNQFNSGILGFRSAAAEPSRSLHFGIRDGGAAVDPNTGEGSFTVDNIVIPEPTTALLGALGLLVMLRRRRG